MLNPSIPILEHSDSQFESIRRFVLGELIHFVKKLAIWFGCCIRLINDHTPIVPYSTIVFRAVQLILLTSLNIYWLVLLSLWSCESDSWWRSRIDISKLSSYGISKTIITWIQDFLTARKFRVRVNLSHSTWSDVTSGIPHRAVF